MLYEIYSAIKTKLATLGLPTEWYNVQYEETIISENGFFIEFPEMLNIESVSKDMRRTMVKIRVHVFSKALRTTDGLADSLAQSHEAVCTDANDLLNYWMPESGCQHLKLVGWQHWHRYKGWMVTFLEYEAKKIV